MSTAVVGGPGLPLVDLNPFDWAGDAIQQGLADTFTAMMMALWSAGLWLIEMVFGVIDRFVTPDVADPGLGRLYGTTLWLSFVVALLVGLGQVGLAAIRRDGRTLGALVVGAAQYGAVVTMWVSVCAVLVLGCAGLTTGLLHQLLGVDGFAGYAASAGLPDRVTGTVQSAVLGLCSMLLLVPAAFGYLLITLVREAALLILTATMPLAAAGALGEGTRAWLWKSIRWFVAACLTAPLLALVVGLGVQISRAAFPDAAQPERAQPSGAVAAGGSQAAAQLGAVADTAQQTGSSAGNVGMAVVGCVILLVACFCPMALFRLLAFVDPHLVRSLVQVDHGGQRWRLRPVVRPPSERRPGLGRRHPGCAGRQVVERGLRGRRDRKPVRVQAHPRLRRSGQGGRGSDGQDRQRRRKRRLDDRRRHGPGRRRPPGLLRHHTTTAAPQRRHRRAPHPGRSRLGRPRWRHRRARQRAPRARLRPRSRRGTRPRSHRPPPRHGTGRR